MKSVLISVFLLTHTGLQHTLGLLTVPISTHHLFLPLVGFVVVALVWVGFFGGEGAETGSYFVALAGLELAM